MDISPSEAAPRNLAPADPDRILITVHGIRTIGQWQQLIPELLADGTADQVPVVVWTFSYGWFSAAALCVPFLRNLVVKRFARWLEILFREHTYRRIDIIAHSFGTFVATKGLERVFATTNLEINTLLLCGSILPPAYRWERWVPKRIKRVVNDCGTRDWIVALCQLAVVGGGAAGRIGFVAMGSSDGKGVFNRYFDFEHSDYFSDNVDKQFVPRYWLPLFESPGKVVPHDSRSGGAAGGVLYWALNNASLAKVLLYGALIGLITLAIWVPIERQRAARLENLNLDAASALIEVGNDSAALEVLSRLAGEGQRDTVKNFLVNVVANRLADSWRTPSMRRFAHSANGKFLVGYEVVASDSTDQLTQWNLRSNHKAPLPGNCPNDDPGHSYVEAVSHDGKTIALRIGDAGMLCGTRPKVDIGTDNLRFAGDVDSFVQWSKTEARVGDIGKSSSYRWQSAAILAGIDRIELSSSGRYVAIESEGKVTLYDSARDSQISTIPKPDYWWLSEVPGAMAQLNQIKFSSPDACREGQDECTPDLNDPKCSGELNAGAGASRAISALLAIDHNDTQSICTYSGGRLKLIATAPRQASVLAISDDGMSATYIESDLVTVYSLATESVSRTWRHPFPETAFFDLAGEALIVTRKGCDNGTCDDISLPQFTAHYPVPHLREFPIAKECEGAPRMVADPLMVETASCTASLTGDSIKWQKRRTPIDRFRRMGCRFEGDENGYTTALFCTGRNHSEKKYDLEGYVIDSDISPGGSKVALLSVPNPGGTPTLSVVSPKEERIWQHELGVPGVYSGFPHQVFFGPEAHEAISYGMSVAGSGGGAGASLEMCALVEPNQFLKRNCRIRYTRSQWDRAGPFALSPTHDVALGEVDDRQRGNGQQLVLIDLSTGLDRLLLETEESRIVAGNFSQNGALVVALMSSGLAQVWEAATGKRLLTTRMLGVDAAKRADILVSCAADRQGSGYYDEKCIGQQPFVGLTPDKTRIVAIVGSSLYVARVGLDLGSVNNIETLAKRVAAGSVDYDFGRSQLSE